MTKLTPEMLLFEVACLLSRHGIPASSDNPTHAVHAATLLLRSLGVPVDAPEPAAITATATLPAVVDEPPATGDPRPGWNLHLPAELPPVRPVGPPRFSRGAASVEAHRVLRLAPPDGRSS